MGDKRGRLKLMTKIKVPCDKDQDISLCKEAFLEYEISQVIKPFSLKPNT